MHAVLVISSSGSASMECMCMQMLLLSPFHYAVWLLATGSQAFDVDSARSWLLVLLVDNEQHPEGTSLSSWAAASEGAKQIHRVLMSPSPLE